VNGPVPPIRTSRTPTFSTPVASALVPGVTLPGTLVARVTPVPGAGAAFTRRSVARIASALVPGAAFPGTLVARIAPAPGAGAPFARRLVTRTASALIPGATGPGTLVPRTSVPLKAGAALALLTGISAPLVSGVSPARARSTIPRRPMIGLSRTLSGAVADRAATIPCTCAVTVPTTIPRTGGSRRASALRRIIATGSTGSSRPGPRRPATPPRATRTSRRAPVLRPLPLAAALGTTVALATRALATRRTMRSVLVYPAHLFYLLRPWSAYDQAAYAPGKRKTPPWVSPRRC
jgi:hypothetical protein